MEAVIGRQTPTKSIVLPYEKTYGDEAVELYDKTGNVAMEWQRLMIYDIMAVNDEGLFTHTKFGFSVPRRNGKSEVVLMRELWGLKNGESILHTAHLTDTSHIQYEKLLHAVETAGMKVEGRYRAYGKEHIFIKDGGRIEFRTRTTSGGLGSGYDLVVIDEAQEYTTAQQTSLNYVVTSSKNPQTIMTGTPPTTVSKGTVFAKYRRNTLAGETLNGGWAEWSVEKMTDVKDEEAWYETSPSLGQILKVRSVADEITGDDIDFNIQRLGLWIQYNQKSAVSEPEWEALKVTKIPEFTGKLFAGVKYGKNGENAALSIAVKTSDDRIFVEAIDCRNIRAGNDWILKFLSEAKVKAVVIDGAAGQQMLKDQMQELKIKAKVILPTVKEIITANAMFEQSLEDKSLCHNGQQSLSQVVTNCEKRAIGSNGGFGFKALRDGMEIALMDSMILAYYARSKSKGRTRQKISY